MGYTNTQAGALTCGSFGNCEVCTASAPSGSSCGTGSVIQSPLTGTLTSVTLFTGTGLPNQVEIATFPVGSTPTSTTSACGYSGQLYNCQHVQDGNSFTVQDVEGLSGVVAQTLTTVLLANPVPVALNQWVAIQFTNTGGVANGLILQVCSNNVGTSCGSIVASGVWDLCLNFGTISPTVGTSYSSTGQVSGFCGNGMFTGGTFTATGQSGGIVVTTQCYGNCGTPPVTLTNTNSTHLINFNQSITLFYEFQSNLNGFILNITASLAKSYNNGQQAYLAIYEIPSCPVGVTPFSAQCPGQQQRGASFAATAKGRFFLSTNNLAVSNGEWVGIALSGSFSGLDINDTNTNVPLFQTSGIIPQIIQSSSSNSCVCKMGLWSWISGNVVINGPPGGGPSGFCDLTCTFIGIIGLGFGTNLLAGGIFYWIIFFLLGCVAIYKLTEGALPAGAYVLYGVMLVFIFSAMGIFPIWVPIVIFLIVSLMASGVLGNILTGRSSGSSKL